MVRSDSRETATTPRGRFPEPFNFRSSSPKLFVYAFLAFAVLYILHETDQLKKYEQGHRVAIVELRESILSRLGDVLGEDGILSHNLRPAAEAPAHSASSEELKNGRKGPETGHSAPFRARNDPAAGQENQGQERDEKTLPGFMVIRAGHKGTRKLCNYSEEELTTALEAPHDHWKGGRRYFVEKGGWMDCESVRKRFQKMGPKEPVCVLAVTNDTNLGCSDASLCVHGIYLRHRSTDALVLRQLYEKGEHQYLSTSQHTFDYILDAGANIGIASILFACMFPSARIISLEASAKNFHSLRLNTAPFPNIHAINAALWPRVSDLFLIRGPRDPGLPPEWGFMVMEKVPDGKKIEETLTGISIPFLLMVSGLPRFDFMKIDIEGSELPLFTPGPGNDLSWVNSAKMVAMEVHNDMVPGSGKAVTDLFSSAKGFTKLKEWKGEYKVYERLVNEEENNGS